MDGEQILRGIIAERFRELAAVPENLRQEAGGRIASFCLGAADALVKAGLLGIDQMQQVLDELYEELERHGLGKRVTATAEATTTVVVRESDDTD